ncbi:RNA polymerase I subunit Rpl135 isoform X3 [Tachypleus tridentatus]|uniref:RNA polymerase I subunit Rpl135 isoform X3 n=1 Tax=Tachypleus tridentatus TaxID=6853 RepID=UPI003FD3AD14
MAVNVWEGVPENPSFKHLQNLENWKPKKDLYQDIIPVELELPNEDRIKLEIRDAVIGCPTIHKDSVQATDFRVYPVECRSRGTTYKGKLQLTVVWSKNGIVQDTTEKIVGEVPVMVKSNVCNIARMTQKQLIRKGEEPEEFGGYFIVNGNEKIVRMLIMQRRNYPIAMTRPSWKNRGKMFTEYGVSLRSVKPDQTGVNMVLHYLTNGTCQLMFAYMKEIFFIPVVLLLKALCDVTDHYIYKEMIKGKEYDSFFKGCVANMLRLVQNEGLYSHIQIKKYIGERFRIKVGLPSWYPDERVTDFLLKQCICVHLDSNVHKFNLLVYMTRKLFALAKGECAIENPDNPMNHEVLLGGHLYLMVLKEKLESWLNTIKVVLYRKIKSSGKSFELTRTLMLQYISLGKDLSRPMEYLLATGNLVSRSGIGLMQFSGLTVVADKLNFFRYLSHFHSIHRGSFFAEMRTTAVRKLLPEAWGFLCPVHTPDGAPCGLLNHFSGMCEIVTFQPPVAHLPRILVSLGMFPYDGPSPCSLKDCYPVLLDGKFVGWVPHVSAKKLVGKLRYMKVMQKEKVPSTLEIAFAEATTKASQYPGIYLFSSPTRMLRPVVNLTCNTIELIGTFEQVYLNICILPEEAYEGITTHQELRETSMLSVLANMIPFSDFNQSPRNMYQCQMGKQTMGTPCYTYKFRSDNKMYCIQTPQSPLVRPVMYDFYHIDDYPLGTNAIVAVISYTGYDMEDAMILNKASLERGFKNGSVYKSEFINLRELAGDRGVQSSYSFGRTLTDKYLDGIIDMDGLPFIGTKLTYGTPMCSYINKVTGETRVEKYKSTESAYVLHVKLCGNDTGSDTLQKLCITLWIPRNPIIGDKFASRHGQKGVCSQQWPAENMPFTESGMTPDIVFNPHGFPSRMTIGMMIESMAGKAAALHGLAIDATPFKFNEKKPAAEYFGELLQSAGYNYYGTERMYSGVDGRELEADIFFGVVYYQRLRHMVADKFQVRTTGPIDMLTHQPVKGRKRAGGIRFGEMERDSLLAHGTSFLLQDRLFNCSDKSLAFVCTKCGSLLSPMFEKPANDSMPASQELVRSWVCATCETSENIQLITVPYVFRYLVVELAAMNIKTQLDVI